MQDSNLLKLSNEEFNALSDQKFFEMKRSITEKVTSLFHLLDEQLKIESKKYKLYVPEGVFSIDSKISKGENYKGLPYFVLDYPRCFKNENIFAFRSMLWWGNYFTFTLHLSGMYLQQYRERVNANSDKIKLRNTFIGVGNNPWVHEINDSDYLPIEKWLESTVNTNNQQKLKFLKLVRKLELDKWKSVPQFGTETFNLFMSLLH